MGGCGLYIFYRLDMGRTYSLLRNTPTHRTHNTEPTNIPTVGKRVQAVSWLRLYVPGLSMDRMDLLAITVTVTAG